MNPAEALPAMLGRLIELGGCCCVAGEVCPAHRLALQIADAYTRPTEAAIQAAIDGLWLYTEVRGGVLQVDGFVRDVVEVALKAAYAADCRCGGSAAETVMTAGPRGPRRSPMIYNDDIIVHLLDVIEAAEGVHPDCPICARALEIDALRKPPPQRVSRASPTERTAPHDLHA